MYQLKFQIHSYWRVGTGRGNGALLDEVVHKDVYGLPSLPGRTVKGLLRGAVYQAEMWKLLPEGYEELHFTRSWFGGNALEQDHGEPRLEIEAGALGVSDARLDKNLREYLIQLLNSSESKNKKQGQRLRQSFFEQIAATAIEYKTGSAKKKSLRTMEVTIPLTLTAQVRVLENNRLILSDWDEKLRQCLPLIQSVGSSYSRGLGRVTVTLEKNNAN